MKILTGHTSPETAYVVQDYPYGFRLRCQIRYWLEFKAGKGVRLVSQTSNPKVAGLVWSGTSPRLPFTPISAARCISTTRATSSIRG